MKKLALLFLLVIGNQLAFAHGGEDDEKPQAKQQVGKNYFTLNSISDVFEMVLRYEPIEAGHPAKMTLFVSDFLTNKAIDSAKIDITSPDNDKLKFVVKQIDKGIYIIEGTFPENKSYSIVANISAGDNADLMTLQGIEVGKKLEFPKGEQELAKTSFFSWQMLLVFLSGMLVCFILLLFIFRRRKITIRH
jgi:hypothetical protein